MPSAILIVEDEATLVRNIQLYLQRSGYEAEAAGSAEEGLARSTASNRTSCCSTYACPAWTA
jgi:DNA-binding response OmpR family regulator